MSRMETCGQATHQATTGSSLGIAAAVRREHPHDLAGGNGEKEDFTLFPSADLLREIDAKDPPQPVAVDPGHQRNIHARLNTAEV